jgi:hypothetical protein
MTVRVPIPDLADAMPIAAHSTPGLIARAAHRFARAYADHFTRAHRR